MAMSHIHGLAETLAAVVCDEARRVGVAPVDLLVAVARQTAGNGSTVALIKAWDLERVKQGVRPDNAAPIDRMTWR